MGPIDVMRGGHVRGRCVGHGSEECLVVILVLTRQAQLGVTRGRGRGGKHALVVYCAYRPFGKTVRREQGGVPHISVEHEERGLAGPLGSTLNPLA